jgi:hypothetical protein
MVKALVAAVMTALALAGVALAVDQAVTFNLTANLKASSEVPKATGVPAGAVGLFKGTAVDYTNIRGRLTWRLTFSKLSGPVGSAHIHVGRPGKAGNVIIPLCGPCKNGQRGAARITDAQLKTIRAGGAYVNVHTAKNAAGEIRGQVKAAKTSSSSSPPPTPLPPPAPEPPPYP